MPKFITAQEAAALIPDHATVGVCGMGLAGWPEEIACAIRDRFKETGHPCDLDVHQGSAMGDWKTRGITRLGEDRVTATLQGGTLTLEGAAKDLARLVYPIERKLS